MFWRKRIYLDYAAGAGGNPSSPHEEGRGEKQKLEDARRSIARLTETKADDIIFTSGATEANALAILGLATPGAHMLYLPSAHASIVENMKIAEEHGVRVEPLHIRDGAVDIEQMKTMLRPETVLVSMDAVCGETGTIWNTREVANALRALERPLLNSLGPRSYHSPVGGRIAWAFLHIDASQAPMTEKITRSHFGADLLVFDGPKLGVPGAGCLVAHRTIPLAPLYGGGGQERELRSGTQNVEAIGKFATTLAAALQIRESFKTHAVTLRTGLIESLGTIPNLYINEGAEAVPNIVNISLPDRDTDYLVALLDEAGFAVSTRSACETDSLEGSRAVLALTHDVSRASSTLRISWGSDISTRELKLFAQALTAAVTFVDSARRA